MSNSSFNQSLPAYTSAQKGFYTTVLSIIMVLIVAGNILVLLVLFRQRKRATLRVTNLFLASLAVVDLSVGLLLLPMSICTILEGGWVFGQPLCQLNGFINMSSGATSILILAAISIDRYFAIVARPGRKLRIKQAMILLGVVTFWGVLIGILPVLGWNYYSYGSHGSICKMSFDHDKGYILFAAITCFVIPLVTMIYCYLQVFLRVRSHRKLMNQWRGPSESNRENQSMKSEMRTAKIVVTVLFVFAGAWTPFVIVHLLQLSPSINIPKSGFSLVTLIAAMHSFCNPIIYTAMNRKFRADLLELLPVLKHFVRCCSFCCYCCRKESGNKVKDFAMEPSRTGIEDKSPLTDSVAADIIVMHGEQKEVTSGRRNEGVAIDGVVSGKLSINSINTSEINEKDNYQNSEDWCKTDIPVTRTCCPS